MRSEIDCRTRRASPGVELLLDLVRPMRASRYLLHAAFSPASPVRGRVRITSAVSVVSVLWICGTILSRTTVAHAEDGVSGLHVRHTAGQSFITWREVDPPLLRDSVSAREIRELRRALEKGRPILYRIYRSERPITSLDGLESIAEVSQLTAWNADYHGVSPRPEDAAFRYVVEDGAAPIPPGTALYVHNPRASGEAYYAVTVVRNGTEDRNLSSGNVLVSPVRESVGPGLPVLQRIERPDVANYVQDPVLHYYVRWEAPPRANTENRPFDYRVGIPPKRVRPAPLGLHLHCWGRTWMVAISGGTARATAPSSCRRTRSPTTGGSAITNGTG